MASPPNDILENDTMKISMIVAALAFTAAPALAQTHQHMTMASEKQVAATATGTGTGKVNSVDAAKRTVNITHQPIQALGWPDMTMDFAVAEGVDLSALQPGAQIEFALVKGADGIYMIDSLTRK